MSLLPPALERVPLVPLGNYPTPLVAVERLGATFWFKCEGDAHPLYGGNKLRTLEAWFGHARTVGAKRLWAIGAYGSNHAIATVLHGARVGLPTGAILFPQPASPWAVENAGALVASGAPIVTLRSVVEVPLAALRIGRGDDLVMPPGGATPIGTIGAVRAAFELAEQIRSGVAPNPARIVLAAGSTCTTAGLLAGIALVDRLGAWPGRPPIVHAVRVTPWPITSRLRIAELAARTLARLDEPSSLAALYRNLRVDGGELGPGYGRPTLEGRAALAIFNYSGTESSRDGGLGACPQYNSPRLDGVYSAKAAAAMLRLHRRGIGPLLLWSSKSSTVLPPPTVDQLRTAPRALRRWLARAT